MVHMKGQCQGMHGPHERVPFKVSLYKMPYFSSLLLHEHVRCPNFTSCLLFSAVFHFLPRFSEMKGITFESERPGLKIPALNPLIDVEQII